VDIVLWWEARRIPYNLIVGGIGLCSLVSFFIAITGSGALEPGEDAVEPIALFAAPFLINFAYTGGWVLEVMAHLSGGRKARPMGPRLLKLGTAFSLGVVCFPALIWSSQWLISLVF